MIWYIETRDLPAKFMYPNKPYIYVCVCVCVCVCVYSNFTHNAIFLNLGGKQKSGLCVGFTHHIMICFSNNFLKLGGYFTSTCHVSTLNITEIEHYLALACNSETSYV